MSNLIPKGTRVYSDRIISANGFKGRDYEEAIKCVESLASFMPSENIISRSHNSIIVRIFGCIVGTELVTFGNAKESTLYYKVRWEDNKFYCLILPNELVVVAPM